MIFRLKATSGPSTGQAYALNAELTELGSSESMDITLAGLEASHARISRSGAGLVIEPVGDSPVFVNGEPVSQAHALQSGDEIRLGSLHLMLQAPGLKPERVLHTVKTKPSRAWLWPVTGVLLVGAAALVWLGWQHPELIAEWPWWPLPWPSAPVEALP